MVWDVVFFVVGLALVVAGSHIFRYAVTKAKSDDFALVAALACMALGIFITGFIGARMGEGRADQLRDLPAGIYHIQGEIKTGEWRALWLAPLDSDEGRLYALPKESVPSNYGPYVQKKDGELVPFKFVTK